MVCPQVFEGVLRYAERVALILDNGDIPTVTQVKLDCRRKQVNATIWEQIVGEDAKATRLMRSKLSVAQAHKLATTTKPTNNTTFTFDGTVIFDVRKLKSNAQNPFGTGCVQKGSSEQRESSPRNVSYR